MEHTVEITRAVFKTIINDRSMQFVSKDEQSHHETITYRNLGCTCFEVFNYTSRVTQYYIQDINA